MNDNMTTATHMFDHSKKLAEAYEKVEPEYEKAAKEARDSCPVSVIDIY